MRESFERLKPTCRCMHVHTNTHASKHVPQQPMATECKKTGPAHRAGVVGAAAALLGAERQDPAPRMLEAGAVLRGGDLAGGAAME